MISCDNVVATWIHQIHTDHLDRIRQLIGTNIYAGKYSTQHMQLAQIGCGISLYDFAQIKFSCRKIGLSDIFPETVITFLGLHIVSHVSREMTEICKVAVMQRIGPVERRMPNSSMVRLD